ncbi:MAG: glutamate 5-kinase [Spirochaetaceae bacterium]|jgi:glutamate 5-kinase|nr:glutamate 5-kinase [Spirochaetaceae bacterium]
MIPQLFAKSRKIVFKFGSSTLTDESGGIDVEFLASWTAQCAQLIAGGKQVVIVSSGAQAAGLSTLDKWARKKDIHYRQALCAVGQVELMASWRRAFAPHNIHTAQILLTRDDFSDSIRTLNMRNTLFTLVDEGIVPVINENDSVYVEEIKIGDNDTLAAQSAVLWGADLLVLFSDIDGIYSENPKMNPDAVHIGIVDNISVLKEKISMDGKSDFGTGGMVTKINAAELCFSYGVPSIITRGKPAALNALVLGEQRGTVFTP